jgi:hypothetical protein
MRPEFLLIFIPFSILYYLQAVCLQHHNLVHGNIHSVSVVLVSGKLKTKLLSQLRDYLF